MIESNTRVRFARRVPRRAEVLEPELSEDTRLVGEPIKNLAEEIAGTFVTGAITRGQSLITPKGDTVSHPGDHLILLAEMDFASELAALA